MARTMEAFTKREWRKPPLVGRLQMVRRRYVWCYMIVHNEFVRSFRTPQEVETAFRAMALRRVVWG